MTTPSRRRALELSASAVIAAVAGCSALVDTGSTNRSSTPTTAAEPATTGEQESQRPDESDVRFEAAVVSQQTADTPTQVEYSIVNESETALTISPGRYGGLPMEYVPPMSNGTGEIVLYPANPEHLHVFSGSVPTERTDGCWSFVPGETGTIGWDDLTFPEDVQPGDRYTIVQNLYYDISDGSCFPPGTYTTDSIVEVQTDAEATLRMRIPHGVSISDDGVVRAERGPFK